MPSSLILRSKPLCKLSSTFVVVSFIGAVIPLYSRKDLKSDERTYIKDAKDFAGQKTFSGRSIKFIINSLKTEQENINKGIIKAIREIYCYPYKKKQNNFKETLINKFNESPNNELMQFLRNDEVIKEGKYGTGQARRDNLGDDFNEVQNEINRRYGFSKRY